MLSSRARVGVQRYLSKIRFQRYRSKIRFRECAVLSLPRERERERERGAPWLHRRRGREVWDGLSRPEPRCFARYPRYRRDDPKIRTSHARLPCARDLSSRGSSELWRPLWAQDCVSDLGRRFFDRNISARVRVASPFEDLGTVPSVQISAPEQTTPCRFFGRRSGTCAMK